MAEGGGSEIAPGRLLVGPPLKSVLIFATPLLIGNLFQQLNTIVDTIVVGRFLGASLLAAAGSTVAISTLILGFASGFTYGFAIRTARAVGSGDLGATRRFVLSGYALTMLGAIALTAVAWAALPGLLDLLGTPPQVLDPAILFARVGLLGTLPTMLYNFAAATYRAFGDSRTPLYFIGASCVLNVVLSVLLVRFLGAGLIGVALATVVSTSAAAVTSIICLGRSFPAARFSPAQTMSVRVPGAVPLLRMGLPMGLQSSLITLGSLVVQWSVNRLGVEAVAAFTICSRIDVVAIAPMTSLGIAIANFVAQNYGARQFERCRRTVSRCSALALAYGCVVGAACIGLGPEVVGVLIVRDAQVQELAETMLLISGSMYFALAALFVYRNALQGMGRPVGPTLAGLLELLVRLVGSVVLVGRYGFMGVCLANSLAWVVDSALLVVLYYRAVRRRVP